MLLEFIISPKIKSLFGKTGFLFLNAMIKKKELDLAFLEGDDVVNFVF